MTTPATRTVGSLPNARTCLDQVREALRGHAPAVFLDYDGTLTPIVDRPEDAVLSAAMRDVVARLAQRCTVCVISGRDRPVVQRLMDLDTLVVAGSHGFDIASPDGAVRRDEGARFAGLLAEVRRELEAGAAGIDGCLVEPKAASVALHYRLVPARDQPRAAELVDQVVRRHAGELKVTPGKMVYEVQPAFDWDKGKAVLYLLQVLPLGTGAVPLYLGDDVTDEDAFEALRGRGLGIVVGPEPGSDPGSDPGSAPDRAEADRATAAEYRLDGVDDVRLFLDQLAR